MDSALRHIRLSTGHVLTIWDNYTTAPHGQAQLRYTLLAPPAGNPADPHSATNPYLSGTVPADVLFCGSDYGVSPMDAIDSDRAIAGLLAFLTLKPGDTDADYFDEYTPAQMDFARSSAAEEISLLVHDLEESRGSCACAYWENLDGWECDADERGNVAAFEVLDHGEDGSQYFPGCGVAFSEFEECATGVGDTAAEALEDALESMAQADARPSDLQAYHMTQCLQNPDKSAFASLDHSECDADHSGDDWNHYVSVRYNVRKES